MSGLGRIGPWEEAGLTAELRDGSFVVGAAHADRLKLEIVLRRVTQDCHDVSSFGKNGVATVTVDHAGAGRIDALTVTPDDRLLLAGSDGPHELVGRLLSTGTVDRSFGLDGWTRFRPRVPNPYRDMRSARVATSIAIGPAGAIFLGGNTYTAHCCTTDYVSELTADGAVMKRFGDGGTVVVPKISGSYITDVVANPDGSVYAFVEYLGSGCGYPMVVRMRADGSLDVRFDSRMAQTFRRVVPKSYTYTPTLVGGQDGKFLLVGGADRICPTFTAHPTQTALAVGVLPSGRLDPSFGKSGVTRVKPFPAPDYGDPRALRLRSGQIAVAFFAYSSAGRPEGDIVAWFKANGSFAGTRRIARAKLPRNSQISGLFPAPGGGAWLAVASRNEFELIPVR